MHVTPVHDDVAPPLADGRYRLVDELGAGGMATVFQVWDSRLHVARAVKVLAPALARHPRTRERFESEARLMARLHHSNLVMVHDVGHDPGGPDGDRAYMVMELLTGGSLADRLLTDGPLPPARACEICRDVLGALQVAHEAGVVHRDIKPHNILLAGDGTPKITDFGIARASNRDVSLTRTGAVMGTWAFMAPEIRSDAKQADAQSDLYAMGATLYMIATGRQPLDLHASNVRDHILSDLPPALRIVIERATEYLPQERYASAREMADALDPLVTELAALPSPSTQDAGPERGGDRPTTLLGDSELPDSELPDSELPDSAVPDSALPDQATAATPARVPPLVRPQTMVPPTPGTGLPRSPAARARDSFLESEPVPTDGGRRRQLASAVVTLLVVAGLGGVLWSQAGGPSVQEGEATAEPTEPGGARGTPEPPVAEAPPDQDPAAENPADENPADENPADENPADEDPADEDPADENPEDDAPAEAAGGATLPGTARPAPAPEPGLLRINSLPPAQVSVDGGPLRDTPIRDGISLSPGPHRLRFVDTWGTERTTTVTVRAGEAQVVCWDIEADAACSR